MEGKFSAGMRACREILLEAAMVGLVGGLLAFAANAVSPRALRLTADYFPAPPKPPQTGSAGRSLAQATAGTRTVSPRELVAEQAKAWGLQSLSSNEVSQLFRDPGYVLEKTIFVDARPKQEYESGHIPGAYEFYRFYAADYVGIVLPACSAAEKIVVYCLSAECDEALHAAVSLRDAAGVSNQKLFVYLGGFAEWATNNFPVERGARNSGELNKSKH
jgi:rhodanese-related sulfurtransferase